MAKKHKMDFKVMIGVLAVMVILAVVLSSFGGIKDGKGEGTQQISNQGGTELNEQDISISQNQEPTGGQETRSSSEAIETGANSPQASDSQQSTKTEDQIKPTILHDQNNNEVVISIEQSKIFTEATRDSDISRCDLLDNEAHKAMCKFAITGERDCDAITKITEFREVCG
ncbi:MAG: hypothetical protein QMD85_00565 [Candidatus Aenigmarchaeota archaeon]|nr:hypothetical protein [Candidatus Aenigmarchaeota archaeon]